MCQVEGQAEVKEQRTAMTGLVLLMWFLMQCMLNRMN